MTSTNLISQNDSHLTINDLQVIEDEPRIKDIILGERLGLKNIRDFKNVIDRNIQELKEYGALSSQTTTEKVGCVNRKITSYYLNEAQALLLCMFSRTAKAAQVRKELIDVYMAYRTRGLAKVREHYRQIAPKPKPLSGFAPHIKNCELITVTTGCLNKTLNIGEITVATKVEGYCGAGIYAIHKMDYKPELYRCIETMSGQIKMMRDNGDPELSCSLKQFNELNFSKIVAVFRHIDDCTEGYKNLQKFLFRPRCRPTSKVYGD